MRTFLSIVQGILVVGFIFAVYMAIKSAGKDIDGAEANAHRYCKMVYEGQ